MDRKEISNVITVAGDGSRESASVRSSRHPEDHLCPLDAAVILQVIVRELAGALVEARIPIFVLTSHNF